jgi:hypothetical protein
MTPMTASTSWPLTVKVGSGFLLRSAVIGLMCLVLGVWGIYDYVVSIPTQELQYHRAEVARQFNRIAEPLLSESSEAKNTDPSNSVALVDFRQAVIANLGIEPAQSLADQVNGLEQVDTSNADASLSLNELGRLLANYLKTAGIGHTPADKVTNRWLATVGGMTVVAQTPMALDGTPIAELKPMRDAANAALNVWGDVQPPSKYDRPMQWMFILCLPFVPWYAWVAFTASKRTYQLDEDGTVHVPAGTWPRDDIAEIDMSVWMRKSKATLVHVDGRRAVLDDYVFKGLFRIIGELAHNQDPAMWTNEAKRVKPDADAVVDEGADAEASTDDPSTEKVSRDPASKVRSGNANNDNLD